MSLIFKFDAQQGVAEIDAQPDVAGVLQEISLNATPRDRAAPANFADAVLARLPVRSLSPNDVDVVAEFLKDEVGLSINLTKRKIARAKVAEILGSFPTSLAGFVRAYTDQFGLEPTLKNKVQVTKRVLIQEDGTEIRLLDTNDEYLDRYNAIWSPNEIDERRVMDRMKIFNEDHKLGFTEAGIERAWGEWVVQKRAEILFWLADKVGSGLDECEHAEADQQWDLFLQAVLTDYDRDHVLTKAVMQHFIWQVGRKIRGMTVGNHMMPVIIGQQGGGKTEMVKRFLLPLGDAWVDSDFAKLADDRHSEVLGHLPVHFLDEMSYASRADIEVTKRKITTDQITYRPLHGNATKTLRNIASFIGCSNQPLGHSIQDPTGTRRFYAISARDRLDWEVINNIKWELLWRSIAAIDASPLDAVRDAVAAEQEAHRVLSPVEEWLAAFDRQEHPHKQVGEWQPAEEIFCVFTEFDQRTNPSRPTSLRGFGIEMTRLAALADTRVERRRDGGGVKYRVVTNLRG
jgi:Virulence-associated protein E